MHSRQAPPNHRGPEAIAGLRRRRQRHGCKECKPYAAYSGSIGEVPTTIPGSRHHPSGWVLCRCQKAGA